MNPTIRLRRESSKSRSAIKRFLVGAVLNAEVGVAAIPTLPFVTASVSTTPEREDEDHTDSVAGLNLRAIGAPLRFVISSDSSHHSGTNVAEAEVDSLVLRIENGAKTGIIGLDLIKFTYYSKSRRIPLEASITPLERAQNYKTNVPGQSDVAILKPIIGINVAVGRR
ncbi:hypothetical protein Tco_0972657 [Tanacetum coccineum]